MTSRSRASPCGCRESQSLPGSVYPGSPRKKPLVGAGGCAPCLPFASHSRSLSSGYDSIFPCPMTGAIDALSRFRGLYCFCLALLQSSLRFASRPSHAQIVVGSFQFSPRANAFSSATPPDRNVGMPGSFPFFPSHSHVTAGVVVLFSGEPAGPSTTARPSNATHHKRLIAVQSDNRSRSPKMFEAPPHG